MNVFIRDECRSVLIESVKYCQDNKGLEVYAYSIMTSHVHLIMRATKEANPLEGIIRDIKSYTSRKIREVMENTNQVHESRREWMLDRMYRTGKYNNNN
ncbi:MAG TPA: transposase [Chryseolinea sp.]|nr:transposase [Chryseolinea sp.]